MTELLFGSTPPLWSTNPFPAVGYLQTPTSLPLGGRPLGMVPGAFGGATAGVPPVSPIDPFGFAAGMVPGAGAPGFGSAPSVGTMPFGQGVTPFTAAAPGGITAQALIVTVAMRRGQPLGPTNDQEIEEFIADALDLLPGTTEVEVRCEGGRATLTGSVPQKRLKRDIGEIAWAIPSINDVQNNITIAARRRSRGGGRESEMATPGPGRKQA